MPPLREGSRTRETENPSRDGFMMPPEWRRHSGCLVSWPCKEETWSGFFREVKRAYAETIRAIGSFERVVVLSDPTTLKEAREVLGKDVDIVEMPLDDSWVRDNGPTIVTSDRGDSAVVQFGFNGWGGRYPPYAKDAKVPETLAELLNVKRYVAPMVLEGGAICVDGEGSVLTTESCLLNQNRNPGMSREEIEGILRSFLGVKKVLWLKQGIHNSMIDGHIDGVAAFVRPSTVILASTDDTLDPNHEVMMANRSGLETMTDAKGRAIEVIDFPMPRKRDVAGNRIAPCYTNFYIANGGIVAPTFGDVNDETAIDLLKGLFPNREVVPVRSEHIGVGGGEVHCITQQIPMASKSQLARLLHRSA
jgi:agmatine deiminase